MEPFASTIVCLVVFTFVAVTVVKPPKIQLPQWMTRFRLNFSLSPLLGVLILLTTQAIPLSTVLRGIIGDEFIKPWQIVILFFSLAYICISLDTSGIYTFLAIKAVVACKGSGKKLFFVFFLLSGVMTIFTSNDIVILTLTPIIASMSTFTKLDPTPYLFAQFFASNIFSISLYIGNPTNIIVGEAFRINFLEYSSWMAIPAFTSGFTCLLLLWLLFRNRLKSKIEFPQIPTNVNIPSAIIGCLCLFGCLILLAASGWLNIPLWIITLVFALVMFAKDVIHDLSKMHQCRRRRKIGSSESDTELPNIENGPSILSEIVEDDCQPLSVDSPSSQPMDSQITLPLPDTIHPDTLGETLLVNKDNTFHWINGNTMATLKRLPWKIIPFVVGMFILVASLDTSGLIDIFASALSSLINWMDSHLLTIFFFTFVSSLACNILNNQPMTILFTSILLNSHFAVNPLVEKASYYSVIMGSNYGANITPIGALAGIMWNQILRDKDIKISYRQFAKYGFIVMPAVIAVGSLALWIEITIWGESS